VEARPRKLSVTEIETWLRDPYAIYARHVLKLRPLDALDETIGPLERGTALHKALELFVAKYPAALPDDAVEQLATIADAVFAEAGVPKAALAVWRPRFLAAAQGFVEIERDRRAALAAPHLEKRGTLTIAARGGDFTLSGVADRIDILTDGSAQIVDYKSGTPPSRKQVEQLLSPQLPLEAAILAAGGFPGIGARTTRDMLYLSLADGRKARKPVVIGDADALAQEAVTQLTRLVDLFDHAATPYLPRVQPFSTDSEGDYDHLARVREWSASGGDPA
jgi:ATP-dependent helicase/nuclease subunit B